MLCAETPIPVDVLQSVFERAIPSRPGVVKSVLGSMGVVLEGVSSASSPVRPMHLSFREFLLDASRSGSWHISEADIAHGYRILALGGLRIMASDLRFNMHSLPSSLSSGDDERKKGHCPQPTLAYITANLDTHLGKVLLRGIGDRNRNVFEQAWRRVLYYKLLFWMEWSIIRGGLTWYSIGSALNIAQQMLTGQDRRFAEDAALFYKLLDNERPPHVYLSGLAFAPAKSLVRQHFVPHFRGIPKVSPLRNLWEDIERVPSAVSRPRMAWSSDCRYISEGSPPSRCWDAQTGDAIDVPPSVDWRYASPASADGRVKVTLLPVGRKLVRVERNLIACSANTTPVRFTIKVGGYGKDCPVDVSPDGNWLMVVDNNNLRLWNLVTGSPAWTLPKCVMDGQLAATFSPDSCQVVSSGIHDDVHYVFPIDQETDVDDIQTVRWVNAKFKPQPQIDDNRQKFPDADLRCTEPDICVPFNLPVSHHLGYDRLVCQSGVRLVLGGLRVDYTDAYYGTEWEHCYAGTIEAEESEVQYAGVDVEIE